MANEIPDTLSSVDYATLTEQLRDIISRLDTIYSRLDTIYRLGGDNPVMSRIDVGVDRIDAGASGIAARLFNIDSRLTAMRNSLRNSDRINGYGHYWD